MLKNLFSRPSNHRSKPKHIVVVSGLPRSGTSMMMKMLAGGGLGIVIDAIRIADEDNPNGYFEFEPVKELVEGNFRWLADANGKGVKIISSLLEYLPHEYQYKIIFMERDLEEVLASQQKMLKNRREDSLMENARMRVKFEKHLSDLKYWLARQPNMELLYVSYNKILADPQINSTRVADFIGISLDVEKMLAVPNKNLYRNRGGKD